MSFSVTVKEELARVASTRDCCAQAELAGFLRMCGNIHIGNGIAISAASENAAVARKFFNLVKEQFSLEVEIMIYKKQRLRKNSVYRLYIPPQTGVRQVLSLLGMETVWDAPQAPHKAIKHDCCRRSYLRGVFLGGGSISDPEGGYHLELCCNDENHRAFVSGLLQEFQLHPKEINRKGSFLLYLKEGEQIVDFLNIIGAHQALLEFENTRIMKEVRNQVNRTVNCEVANVNKISETGLRQNHVMQVIAERIGIDNLPENLREVALLRLSYPDISLKELGELCTPTLGKSGVNHRLRKLERIAETLLEEEKLPVLTEDNVKKE